MKFYNKVHKYTCGIDLHAKNYHACIFDDAGNKMLHRRFDNDEKGFLRMLAPYRADVVVSVESTFNWYWLGDLCAREGIPFVLGHAQYMKAIHQGKTKNDRIDSEKNARLTSARMLPIAYAYPVEMRKVRDLLRRRLYFVRQRAAIKGHVKIVGAQYNARLEKVEGRGNERYLNLLKCFDDVDLQETVDCDLQTTKYLDSLIRRIEKYVLKRVVVHNKEAFALLCTMPGIGAVLGLTILYEMHTLKRFRRCQDFMSYSRLVRAEHSSNGKKVGAGQRKIGNPYIKWALSEVAVHLARISPEVALLVESQKRKYGDAGAWSRLSQKIGRTVYYMLKNNKPFDLAYFLKNSRDAVESELNSLEPYGSHGH